MLGRGQCLKKKPMYVWSTFLPFLFSMHSHLLLDPTGTWNNLPFFATPKRWTDEQVHHLWVWAFDFRRGVGRVGWTHELLASQLPPRTWKQFWPFLLDHQGSLFKKGATIPIHQIFSAIETVSLHLPEAKRIAPPEVWWLEDHLISLSTFISECCKENIPGCTKQMCFLFIKQEVFFSKKHLTKRTEPWSDIAMYLEGTDATRKWMVEW